MLKMSEEMKKCSKMLHLMKKHTSAYPFLTPVDPIGLKIPDYLEIVKEPIDLSTIENNLRNNM